MRASTLQRLLTDEITLTPNGATDQYGVQADGTPVTIRARVAHEVRRSVDDAGQDWLSTTQVATLTEVRVGDTLTIGGEARLVKQVKSAAGTRGGATLYEAHL